MSFRTLSKFIASLSLFACASVFAAPTTINVAGVQSYGEFGDSGNTVLNVNIGADAHVIGVSYNVNVTAFSPSWLSEIGFAITDSTISEGVLFLPGFGVDASGTASYSDTIDLVFEDLSFYVGADGILRIEFYEDYSDELFPDGIWNSGTISFVVEGDVVTPPTGDVPEPGSMLLLGAGLAALGYTSRRRAAATKAIAA